MKKLLWFFIVATFLPLPVMSQLNFYNQDENIEPPKPTEHILIILDSSYSMADKIDGIEKMAMAKDAINNVLQQVDSNLNLGLRVYGHKDGIFGVGACKASELMVPIKSNTAGLISQELSRVRPVGWTPICYSLEQAIAGDFGSYTGRKRIILVSDGMETCYGNPCDYALDLVQKKVNVKIDVIGFDLDDPAAVSQLKCTALATKGKFYSAGTSSELAKSLKQSIDAAKEVQGLILTK